MNGGKRAWGPVDRLIDWTEKAAGIFLAGITVLIFSSIMLRAFGGIAIPDWYDFSRLMLGVTIFWGIAATSYRNLHIKVDILWEALNPRGRLWIDIAATVVLLLFLAAFSWMLVAKVRSGFYSGEGTFDTRVPVWPFHLMAALGIFFATVLVCVRLARLLSGKAADETRLPPPVE